MIESAGPTASRPTDPPAFLRFDPPELRDGSLIVRGVPARLREGRRLAPGAPLGYLYQQVDEDEPEHDLAFTAGHYDEDELVWRFSGEVTGIAGITEPFAGPPPGEGSAGSGGPPSPPSSPERPPETPAEKGSQ
ncbi:hypothetical protein ABZ801_39710 [Actinomadura sp. NPDC047616]|uniref:hypothetical protein n=1 Tax=Actinomadura sp. NPDC047616 TaxID=3155914 RepID=UPI0033BFDAE9